MNWASALAIYALFWVFSGFFVLPFHARPAIEHDEPLVPGQAPSAPVQFQPWRAVLHTTILSVVTFGLYYWAYASGAISFV